MAAAEAAAADSPVEAATEATDEPAAGIGAITFVKCVTGSTTPPEADDKETGACVKLS